MKNMLEKIVSSLKSSTRKIGLVSALTASSLLGNGCGSGGSSEPAPTKPTKLTQEETDLVGRLAEAQLTNGSWDLQQLWYDPINYASQGSKGITGITAMGLLDAYRVNLVDGNENNTWSFLENLRRAKDCLYQVMDDFNKEVGPSVGIPVSIPNFEFMRRYNEYFNLSPVEQATVQTAWDKLLDTIDASDGTDPNVRVDGVWNKIITMRTNQGIPELIGWDNSFIIRSALAMNEPTAEIDWLRDKLKNLPFGPETDHGLDSIAHTLYALNLAGDSSVNVYLLKALKFRRNFDGSYGSNPESHVQTSAYTLMALKEIGSPDAALTHDWLTSQIRSGGQIYDPVTAKETFEVEGEVLYTLLQDRNP